MVLRWTDGGAPNNAFITLTTFATPDPFLVRAHGRYFLTCTCGDRIDILASSTLVGFRAARPTTVWRPSPSTRYSAGLWAPELHALDGRWYIYFAAEHPAHGHKSHRMYVLGGPSQTHDPTIGPWQCLGTIRGMPEEQWAIDGTVFELKGAHYFVYSGWPRGECESDLNQELFIMSLDTPIRAGSAPVRISKPSETWEQTRDSNGLHGINEGPQWLAAPNNSWCGIVYSCGGSWTCEYKMGVLHFQGGDPLNPASWRKDMMPLLQSKSSGRGPFGPGHGNFISRGDRVLGIFHATDEPTDGWNNRKARAQIITWSQHGPYMGKYIGTEIDHFEEME